MRKIRKGKDIAVRWPILTNGAPASLDGRDLKLFIKSQYNVAYEIVEFTTEDNVVIFTFRGTEQQMLGAYKLTLWENYGRQGQTAVDCCDVFTLVPCTCEEMPGDKGLTTETVDLESSSIEVGIGSASCIVEAASYLEFPTVGKSGKLYIDRSQNKTYRWDEEQIRYICIGSDYEEISLIFGGNPDDFN